MEKRIMTPSKPSRRGILGALSAFLCGFLFVSKAPAQVSGSLPVPMPEALPLKEPISSAAFGGTGTITTLVYDAAGQRLYSSGLPGPTTTYTYDGSKP
jgi:hypothetical protein